MLDARGDESARAYPIRLMNDQDLDDRRLVDAAKGGSEEAFEELVRRYYERVYRNAYRILDSAEDAEEVVQETFSRAVLALERFDHRASFFTWIVSIARNAAFDQLRVAKRRAKMYGIAEGFDDIAVDRDTASPVTASAENESATIVRKGLMRLKERDRTLLVLREYDGLQYEEIAKIMKCSVGTIESGIHRARKKLRYFLQALDPAMDTARENARIR
jgi:RNA polymerase sigma-70 factor, ECF subfamily